MNAAQCTSCGLDAEPCAVCGADPDLHEHVYAEWFCQRCWRAFAEPEQSQDADCFAVIDRASGG